jgi:hypothetical protein
MGTGALAGVRTRLATVADLPNAHEATALLATHSIAVAVQTRFVRADNPLAFLGRRS